MKRTLSINIAGVLFNIDSDAYNTLNLYLHEIKQRFTSLREANEIIADIESRIAEIFIERDNEEKQTININDVNYAINIIGQPQKFGDKNMNNNKKFRYTYNSGQIKRLYRDPDNRIISGTCSGLGYYLGIDPIIIRILFVFSVIFLGTGTLIYILLWIFIPLAHTDIQKAEMRGEL